MIRNIAHVFRGMPYQGRRLVVTDRFYTSIPMAQQLRSMGFTFVGTMQKTRLGWCPGVVYKVKKRPKSMARGFFKMATAKSDPGLVALGWMDNRPVYFLGSNVSAAMTTIERREKTGAVTVVPCPQLVKDYQTYMGGVDKHDQLRLQSYSLQLNNRFVKYYKSLFLGFVDMAIVNGYIVHNLVNKTKGVKEKTHAEYQEDLQASLVGATAKDFECEGPAPARVAATALVLQESEGGHVLTQSTEQREHGGVKRLLQRACKVCSVYRVRRIDFSSDVNLSLTKRYSVGEQKARERDDVALRGVR